jgi:hypothetical protein
MPRASRIGRTETVVNSGARSTNSYTLRRRWMVNGGPRDVFAHMAGREHYLELRWKME